MSSTAFHCLNDCRFQPTLEYVTRNTGSNVSDLTTAEEIFDVLLIEKQNGYHLPRWVDDSTYMSLSQIADMTFYFDFSTKLILRLRTGLLLKDIISHIEEEIKTNKKLVSDENSGKKFYIYSTVSQKKTSDHSFDKGKSYIPGKGSHIF